MKKYGAGLKPAPTAFFQPILIQRIWFRQFPSTSKSGIPAEKTNIMPVLRPFGQDACGPVAFLLTPDF
jgi:hypothetical protein